MLPFNKGQEIAVNVYKEWVWLGELECDLYNPVISIYSQNILKSFLLIIMWTGQNGGGDPKK